MLSHPLGSLAGSTKEGNEVGVLASPSLLIFDLLPGCLTCTLYSQVDSCYWAVSKHVPWNTFVGSTIRRVDILKSECVVFEETQRHIVQAYFQVWRWDTLSSTRKSYRVSRYHSVIFGVWSKVSFDWFVCWKAQKYRYWQSQTLSSCLCLLLASSQLFYIKFHTIPINPEHLTKLYWILILKMGTDQNTCLSKHSLIPSVCSHVFLCAQSKSRD